MLLTFVKIDISYKIYIIKEMLSFLFLRFEVMFPLLVFRLCSRVTKICKKKFFLKYIIINLLTFDEANLRYNNNI